MFAKQNSVYIYIYIYIYIYVYIYYIYILSFLLIVDGNFSLKNDEFRDKSNYSNRGCSRGAVVKALDCGIVVREFVPQSRYYVHFRANTLGKGISPLILLAMG